MERAHLHPDRLPWRPRACLLRMKVKITVITVPVLAACAAMLGVFFRARAIPPVVGDADAVGFAKALLNFDVFAQSPHLPGYPVYVFFTRAFSSLGAPEEWALALPALVLWIPSSLVFLAGARRHIGDVAALGAVIASSLAPGAVLAGGWPGSDGTGLALLLLFLGLSGVALSERFDSAARPSRSAFVTATAAGAAGGLLLGVRLSWWPIVLPIMLWPILRVRDRQRARPALVGGALGVLIWLVPLLVIVGPRELAQGALLFGKGHTMEWGGTILSTDVLPLERCLRALWDLWDAGLGAAWIGTIPMAHGPPRMHAAIQGELAFSSIALAIVASAGLAVALGSAILVAFRVEGRERWIPIAIALAIPYAAWVLLLQNVEKPRHVLAFLPLVGALIARGLGHLVRPGIGGVAHGLGTVGTGAAAIGVAALIATDLERASLQGTERSPAAELVAYVAATHSPERLQIFAGEEARLFEHLAPMYRTWRPRDALVLAREARSARVRGAEVLVSSGAPGFAALKGELEPLVDLSAPESVRGHDARLVLYRFNPSHGRRLE